MLVILLGTERKYYAIVEVLRPHTYVEQMRFDEIRSAIQVLLNPESAYTVGAVHEDLGRVPRMLRLLRRKDLKSYFGNVSKGHCTSLKSHSASLKRRTKFSGWSKLASFAARTIKCR